MSRLLLRNIAYSIILLGLLLVVILLRTRTPFGKDNSSFSSNPEQGITRIEITQGKTRLVLTGSEEGWFVNGKDKARYSAIQFISSILTEIRIKSTVSDDYFVTEIKEKIPEPVRVRVFEKRRVLSSFLVYKTASNSYGNIMKLNERAKPFIMHLPGFEGDIGSVFTTNELYWKPYIIFELLPSEITAIELEHSTDTASSFRLFIDRGGYRLTDWQGRSAEADSVLIKRFITYFTMVPFENWAFDLSDEEHGLIVRRPADHRLAVQTGDGRSYRLELWERTRPDGTPDSDRLWGRTDKNDKIFIIRYFDIDPVLKKRSYFLKHREPL